MSLLHYIMYVCAVLMVLIVISFTWFIITVYGHNNSRLIIGVRREKIKMGCQMPNKSVLSKIQYHVLLICNLVRVSAFINYLSIKIGMSDRPTALHTAPRPQRRYHWAWRAMARRRGAQRAESKQGQDYTERSDVSACYF